MDTLLKRLAFLTLTAILSVSTAQAQQVWRVGANTGNLPFGYQNAATNQFEGAMVDIITAIAQDVGARIEVVRGDVTNPTDPLINNEIDIQAAATQMTPARQELIDFTDPIFSWGYGLFVNAADNTDYHTIEDLRGQTVGGVTGSASFSFMQNSGLFAEVKPYDDFPPLMEAISIGAVRATIGNEISIPRRLAEGGFPNVKQVPGFSVNAISNGLGVRKGETELLATLNAGLAKLRADGRLVEIAAKWEMEAVLVH